MARGASDATDQSEALRALPSVDELLARPQLGPLEALLGRAALRAAARAAVAQVRSQLRAGAAAGAEVSEARVAELALRAAAPSLRRVINATGVPLHTNLGRAPLHPEAVARVVEVASGWSSLELDLDTGVRGHRIDHVERLLCDLFGAPAAFAVNNCAGATLLALSAVGAGRAVVVSRSELVEIGGGFRVPDILGWSGCRMVEVGTTNKSRIADHAAALDQLGATEQAALERAGSGAPPPALLLRVHRSNFALVGFTAEPSLAELAALARARGVPLLHDLGSGAAGSPAAPGLSREPTAADSLRAGVDLVLCSGDKLLAGPQAGLILGEPALVDRCRRHPLARALRLDKLLLAALEATLRLHLAGRGAELPALAALGAGAAELEERAALLGGLLEARGVRFRPVAVEGRVGGGSLPLDRLPSRALALSCGGSERELAARLRRGRLQLPPGLDQGLCEALGRRGFGAPLPPVLALQRQGAVLLDLRCVGRDELAPLAAAIGAAVDALARGDGVVAETLPTPGRGADATDMVTLEGEEEV